MRQHRCGQASCLRHWVVFRSSIIAPWRSLLGFGWAAVALGPTTRRCRTVARRGDRAPSRARRAAGAVRAVAPTPIAIEEEGGDDVTAAVGGHGDDIPPLLRPEIRGDGGLRLRTGTVLADGAVRARFGVTWQPSAGHPISFDGTAISAPLGAGRIYASVERRHWGPSWTGSLILDAGAEAIPSIGWRKSDPTPFRTPWLAWLGPWSLDAFAGGCRRRTDRSTRTCSACACR